MSEANTQLRSIVDRLLRLNEERKTITDDIKEVCAEAKSGGYNPKALRALVIELMKDEPERNAAAELSAEIDLYREAYHGGASHVRVPARAREIIGQFPAHDAETGEITEPDATPAGAVVAETSGATAGETAPLSIAGVSPQDRTDDGSGDANAGGEDEVAQETAHDLDRKAGAPAVAAPASSLNPRCLKPATCKWAHAQVACWQCNAVRSGSAAAPKDWAVSA